MKLPHWLEKLVVRRVSLVDNPANPHAQVMLFKSGNTITTGTFAGVTALVGGDPQQRGDTSAVPVHPCTLCGADGIATMELPGNNPPLARCRSCGKAGELVGGKLVPIAAKGLPQDLDAVIAKSQEAIAASHAARLESWKIDGYQSNEDAMSALEQVQKSHGAGSAPSQEATQLAAEELAAVEYGRGLSREAALAKAWATPLHPFRAVSADNPPLAKVWAAAGGSENVIAKQASESENEAWRRLRELAAQLRKTDQRLTEPAAISKVMGTAEGAKLYDLYARAQRIRQGAA